MTENARIVLDAMNFDTENDSGKSAPAVRKSWEETCGYTSKPPLLVNLPRLPTFPTSPYLHCTSGPEAGTVSRADTLVVSAYTDSV